MNCRSAESLFSAFLDDELNQKERRGLEAHLLSCKRCALSVRELRVALDFLHEMPQVETSPHFEADVMARIRSGEAMRPSMVEWFRRWLEPAVLRPFFLAGAGACAVWIAVQVAPQFDLFGRKNAMVAENGKAAATSPATAGVAAGPVSQETPVEVARIDTPSRAVKRTVAPSTSGVAVADRAPSSGDATVDDALPNPGARYVDEYITDQFYLERQVDGADPEITPVSGRASDDVYIEF